MTSPDIRNALVMSGNGESVGLIDGFANKSYASGCWTLFLISPNGFG